MDEIRSVKPKIRLAYGRLSGRDVYLVHLDEALLEAERLVLVGPVTEARKEECRAQMYCCARELASVWTELNNAQPYGIQTKLEGGT